MSFYHEKYCLVPWRRAPPEEWSDEQAREADLPDYIHSELLAIMGYESDEGPPYPALYLVRWPKNELEPSGMKPVSEELARLLKAGRAYPPALAIARDAVGWTSGFKGTSEGEAIARYTQALRAELDGQRDHPYFLAKCLKWQYIGYIAPGNYTWILRYDPTQEEPLWYVSGDYEAYTCPVEDFDIDVAWMCERFGVSPNSQ